MTWWKPSPILVCLPAERDERGSTVRLPDPGVAGLLPATYRLFVSAIPTVAASTFTGWLTVSELISTVTTLACVPPHSAPQLRMYALLSSAANTPYTG